MKTAGFTLLELAASLAILALVTGMLFALATSLGDAAALQEAKMTTHDEARQALEFVVDELRQAAAASITGTLPGASISYRVAVDLDGNGTAVDAGGNLELSPVRTFQRDAGDLNGDGIRLDQLVRVDANGVRVVGNGLALNEDLNNNGVLDGGEDRNGNNVLDRGLWFERAGSGIRVTVQSERRAGPRGPLIISTLTEVVSPRN